MNKSNNTITGSCLLKGQVGKFTILISFALAIFCFPLFGQDDKKPEEEKMTPRMGLTSTQINGDSILLEASVKVKREGSWQPVDYESVSFEVRNDSVTMPLGKTLTSDKGIASVKVGKNQLVLGADGLWIVGSVFEGTEIVREGDAEVSIKPAGVSLAGEKQDTIYMLTLKLYESGSNLPIADAEVGFYVKRHFSNLKIGDGTTDENGEVTFQCPLDIPGDNNGNIILIGKADDLEEYGSVAAFVEKPWGIPTLEPDHQISRALWSHAPPLWMVIVFAILMTTVWGHYIVIIYKLFKLRNAKLHNP